MTKEQLLARIDNLLLACKSPSVPRPEPEHLFNGALTVMEAVYGRGSQQVNTLLKRREEIAKLPNIHRDYDTASAVQGALQNLREEVDGGLLTSIEQRVTSSVLSDLVQLARAALNEDGEGPKNVAAVLVAAAYEDTLRRIAKEHSGVIGQDKLSDVIDKLKQGGLLVAPQLGIALGYLSFRNHALHAKWDQIDRTSVESVLAFIEQLLLKHFS